MDGISKDYKPERYESLRAEIEIYHRRCAMWEEIARKYFALYREAEAKLETIMEAD